MMADKLLNLKIAAEIGQSNALSLDRFQLPKYAQHIQRKQISIKILPFS